MGHNVATVTRPNCFPTEFFRLKRFSKIHLAVFPKAKLFSDWIFPVKNEIQNWIPEFARHYGMPARDHCGDATEMIGNGIGKRRRKARAGLMRQQRGDCLRARSAQGQTQQRA